MTGVEFYNQVLSSPKYRKEYEQNTYFNMQMQYLRQKEHITKATLLSSIIYLSRGIQEAESRMIEMNDMEAGL